MKKSKLVKKIKQLKRINKVLDAHKHSLSYEEEQNDKLEDEVDRLKLSIKLLEDAAKTTDTFIAEKRVEYNTMLTALKKINDIIVQDLEGTTVTHDTKELEVSVEDAEDGYFRFFGL